jgi:hypothetical protein
MDALVRVLFLDIDGVLNRKGYQPEDGTGLRSWIEPELAARLSEVLQRTAAVIVLSSDWRLGRTKDELIDELHAAGVAGILRDVTPTLPGRPRWSEIQAWLDDNALTPDKAVIVDDLHDMGPLHGRFVQTRAITGLDDAAARRIAQLFGLA